MENGMKWVAVAVILLGVAAPLRAQKVIVLSGLDETIAWHKAENW